MNYESQEDGYKIIHSDVRDLTKEIKSMHEKITILRVEVAQLQVKSTIWGMLGGFFATILFALSALFLKK